MNPNSPRKNVLADELERQLGGDKLPAVWSIPAQDVRLIIAALRAVGQSGPADAGALLQRWYDLYGGSTLEIRAKYPEDKYAQGEMETLDKDTEKFLGIDSQYERSATEGGGT